MSPVNQHRWALIVLSSLILATTCIYADDSDTEPQVEPISSDIKDKAYISPQLKQDNIYLFETFDDETQFKNKWIQSKEPQYEGEWKLESGPDRPRADLQLVLPLKARHYGISSKLAKPFKFSEDKPLIVQYEVQFRESLDCGGAYVKLLRNEAASLDLTKLNDKTPFTIMFGPDKCGSESKLHFIIQYLNPKTNEYEEKHWKQSKQVASLMSIFSDKSHHLFKLLLEPNNNFEIFLDDTSVGKGNLLSDLDPAINPAKDIVDLKDTKPEDWDERPKIDDPEAKKPEDWDEDAPKQIEDPDAVKPADWLDNEPQYIPDPEAKKPEDWEEMDGEWEAPKIENPACAKAAGCGEWKRPMIANPNYKGKWSAPKIDNPNYKGKWAPRMIPNPDYFYDEKPFSSLEPIGSIAFELWSMTDNISFDNFIITSDNEQANVLKVVTWPEKKSEADASSSSVFTRFMSFSHENRWVWGLSSLPLLAIVYYMYSTLIASGSAKDASAKKKKSDESKPDASPAKGGETENDSEGDDDDDDNNNDGDEDTKDGKSNESGDAVASTPKTRKRKSTQQQ